MSDDWTQRQLREIRHLAPNYGWQGAHKDGDVIRWINSRAPACLEEFKRQAKEARDATNATYEAESREAQTSEQPKVARRWP
jgi:hypothetical protein